MTFLDPAPELWPDLAAGPLPTRPKPRRESIVRRFFATLGFLASATRRRPLGRRILGIFVALLAISGIALATYPFYTHFQANQRQSALGQQYHSIKGDDALIDAWRRKDVRVEVGAALTRLIIPKLKVNVIVVEGTTGNALRAGAGHYANTPLPGEAGNVSIAGHRTGFGQPFRHLDRLRPGDKILLETPIGRYTYELVPPFEDHGNPWITGPKDFSVIAPTVEPMLTLTTCDPPHTSLNRLIVRAKLVKSEVAA